ncbi:MAG TPA: signal peptidase II [Anaerolineales bacterium]
MKKFLKPSWLSVIFLIELPAFLLIELVTGGRRVLENAYVLLVPAIFYYLVACGIMSAHRRGKSLGNVWKLLGIAAGLAMVDQGTKVIILNSLPEGERLVLIPGSLNLAHVQNWYGPWLFQQLGWASPGNWVLSVIFILVGLVCLAAHSYYTAEGRKSLLADLAMAFTLSSFVSGFIDIGIRGFTLDFLDLPGYVVADLKDVLVWFGVACLLAEMLDSPEGYWKMGMGDFLRAIGRMMRYIFKRVVEAIFSQSGILLRRNERSG